MKLSRIYHFFKPKKCIQNIELHKNKMFCKKCKEVIGIVYYWDGKWNPLVFPRFKLYTREIGKWVKNLNLPVEKDSELNVDELFNELKSLYKILLTEETLADEIIEDT